MVNIQKRTATALIAIIQLVVTMCHAQDYNFSGVLTDIFVPATEMWTPGYTFKQTCGRLVAHNSNAITTDLLEAGYLLKSSLPKFTQSWTLSAKVTIPFSAEALPSGTPSTDEFAEIGIACFFKGYAFPGGLQVYPSDISPTRVAICEAFTSTGEVFAQQGEVPYGNESATVCIRFNSTNKVLQFFANGTLLMDIDIAADGQHSSPHELAWSMTDNDEFQIGVFANSQHYPVSPEAPLQLDDFTFHIDGQAPTSPPTLAVNRNAVELECTGKPAQRHELQASENLTNWFTIQSFYGTGGTTRIPVSSDATNVFFRIRP
jgi:hypothetical protein